MATKYVTAITAIPGTKLFGTDPKRLCFSIFVPRGGNQVFLSDNDGDFNMYYIQPGEIVFISSLEGHDVTCPWYARCDPVGSGQTCLIYEAFAPDIIMKKLAEKGIDSTAGLAVLVVAGLLAA